MSAGPIGNVADYTGELFVLGGIFLTGVVGWVSSIIIKRLREPTRIETLWERLDILTKTVYGDPEDPKAPGLLARMEAAERRDMAKGRVIRSLARQWPSGSTPRLNPSDLEELDEKTLELTHPWRMKP